MSQPIRYYNDAPLELTNVDQDAGILRNVALMSIGEALGHNCRVDLSSLQGLFQLCMGKSIKAFLNHSYNPAPTEVVGVFSGIYIDNEKGVLRASQFKALDAFKTHNRQAYDTLFELAITAPDSFGVSVSIYQELEDAEDGGAAYIRPTSIESADFVSSPAANKALFSQNCALDVSKIPIHEVEPEPAPQVVAEEVPTLKPTPLHSLLMSKKIYAAFKARPDALIQAIAYAAEAPEGTTEDKVVEVIQEQLDAADQKAIIDENANLKAKVSELEAKIAELSPEAAKVEGLSAKIAEQDVQLAEFSKRTARFGVRPVAIKPVVEDKPAPVLTRAQFAALDPKAQGEHFAARGKLTE